jgi:hypothetical protein
VSTSSCAQAELFPARTTTAAEAEYARAVKAAGGLPMRRIEQALVADAVVLANFLLPSVRRRAEAFRRFRSVCARAESSPGGALWCLRALGLCVCVCACARARGRVVCVRAACVRVRVHACVCVCMRVHARVCVGLRVCS